MNFSNANILLLDGDHTNFILANDAKAKEKVKALLIELGWKNENILDSGDITSPVAVG